jgi:YD repeat-containing protein
VRVFDTKDHPTTHSDGNHGWDAEFDNRGNEIARKNVGIDDQPTLVKQGYSITRATYDDLGRQVSVRHFDTANQPTTDSDGKHGWDAEYDAQGNKTEQRYVDTNGKPRLTGDGFAIVRGVFDKLGRPLSVRFFDASGRPTSLASGMHGWNVSYDEAGREISRSFVDRDGNQIEPSGALITSVHPGSNAARSGLAIDDVVVEYDGKKVASDIYLTELISQGTEDKSSDSVSVIVSRAGEVLTLKVASGDLGVETTTKFGRPNLDSESSQESKSD